MLDNFSNFFILKDKRSDKYETLHHSQHSFRALLASNQKIRIFFVSRTFIFQVTTLVGYLILKIFGVALKRKEHFFF